MFQFIPVHENTILAVRISGAIEHEDYQQFVLKLEEFINPDEKMSLLLEFDNFIGSNLATIKNDFNIGLKYGNVFTKIAIVGQKKWQKWMGFVSSPFIKGNVKYFDRIDFQSAWDWLREKELSDVELAEKEISPYSKIMVGIDFSPHSLHAARRAVELAKSFGAKLQLVHIVNEAELSDLYYEPYGISFGSPGFPVVSMEDIQTANKSVIDSSNKQMSALTEELGLDNNQGIVLEGRPKTTLISYSEAQDVDLIVMGTHGLHGIDRILGSSTRYVQNHARCEVLSIPLTSP